MKKLISIFIASLIVLFAASCESLDVPTQQQTTAPETETATAFDLEAYKSDVQEFRTSVMDNSLLLYNVGSYEVNYLKALGTTSDSTADKGFEWLSKQTDATRESVDDAHQSIRDEYAELILVNIEGKEAEELDGYVRSMYEGYSALYDCVTSNSLTSSQLTSEVNAAIACIEDADANMGLFID